MSNQTKDASTVNPSRRNLLRLTVAGLLSGVAAPVLSKLPSARAADTGIGNAKVLIVFYSRSGNTREIASRIHERAGGDMMELQTVEPYPGEYSAVTKQAKEELQSGYKPALKTRIGNISSYDAVFVGSPNWWSTVASPVRTFLSGYDLSGKRIAPFITHAGSGLGRSVTDIAAMCPNATILEGLAVWGTRVRTAQGEVSEWLRRIGMGQ